LQLFLSLQSPFAQGSEPPSTPILVGSFFPINNGAGDQTNPHVACDLASYTNDDFQGSSTIHYWDFATSTDHMVPGTRWTCCPT